MDQLMLLKPGKDYAEGIFRYRNAFIMAGDSMDGTGSLYRMPDPRPGWIRSRISHVPRRRPRSG